jgi:NAD(P)-dependent dehydrogenase (short-subunit alcohol dehydrogenase family)
MADDRLAGKVAIITGGAGGIGSAVARALVEHGARVALVDKDVAQLERVAGEVGSALPITADVTLEEDVQGYVRKAVEELGRVDFFFNNAGIEGPTTSIPETPVAEFDRVIAINVRGVYLGLQAVLPVLERQGWGGSIVCTASMAGLRGGARFAPYIASKHAVIGLARTAALEAAEFNVRVNAIAPGFIDTRMLQAIHRSRAGDDHEAARDAGIARVPLGRLGSADEVARLVRWLFSDESSYITGSVQVIDGGLMA